jgi:thioredoxin reductase
VSDVIDVAIVGAGPYGLSLAAHLRAAGVEYRQFGLPMRLWQAAMPRGMFLKSQGFASNISDPAGTHTLEAFCAATNRPYASYGLPVPLDTFVSYGQWFASDLGLPIEETLVTDVSRGGGGFSVTLADGERLSARRVVVAIGVEHFAHVPAPLSSLPPELCTHSSAHPDLATFSGQDVIVVGAGQSALESAALLHESGANVRLLARKQRVVWNGEPLALERPLPQRLREPESGLGSGWATWFYSNHPELFRRLPRQTRVYRARTALGPAGASWLRARVEGKFPVAAGHTVTRAEPKGDGVMLAARRSEGGTERTEELVADHVIAATGYRTDLARLPFLGDELRSRLRTVAGSGSPSVTGDYRSAVPGLYIIGPAVAPTMGPVMRFVFGSRHAATTVSRHLTSASRRSQPATAVTAAR